MPARKATTRSKTSKSTRPSTRTKASKSSKTSTRARPAKNGKSSKSSKASTRTRPAKTGKSSKRAAPARSTKGTKRTTPARQASARRTAPAPDDKLGVYRKKRDFALTPEPAGDAAAVRASRGSGYIIQKHDARRLHYDFRLELDGVLLSWAVPKGPSLVPTERRLAVRTEDHPLEYADFEGVIPAGEYGGGTVMLWDRGTWTPDGDPRQGLRKGRLTFELHGERLTGRWHLVRTSGRPGDRGDNWLLFKGRDDEARDPNDAEPVDEEQTSVSTGRSMDQIAADRDRTWRSNRDAPDTGQSSARKPPARRSARPARSPNAPELSELVSNLSTSVSFTNLDKVLYPEQGLTKAALIAYYAVVADWILPHIADRPLTLVRCPNGPHQQCFYQKHKNETMLDAIRPLPLVEEDGEERIYMAIDDLDGLLAVVQLGSLELHTWGSHVATVERPDLLVFDLDPDEGLPWQRVVEAALDLRAWLEDIGLTSWPKTTGGKGLHVCVPVAPRLDWDTAKAFTKAVADTMQDAAPARFTTNMSKAKRKGKIFVDYLRNGRGATFIAPYSTRRHARAPVATPVTWDELEAGIDPGSFTVETIPARLDALSEDPWADLLASRQSITAAMRRRVLGKDAA